MYIKEFWTVLVKRIMAARRCGLFLIVLLIAAAPPRAIAGAPVEEPVVLEPPLNSGI
jgi:hypothetical protein